MYSSRPARKQLQEVNPTLAVGAREVSEQLIANVGTISILTLMTRAAIVDMDVVGVLKPNAQQRLLLRVKFLLALGEDRADLAGGDLNAPFPQLLKNEGLSDWAWWYWYGINAHRVGPK